MLDAAVDAAVKRQRDAEAGQTSLFDVFDAADHGMADDVPPPDGDEWEKGVKLAFEKEMLGIYVSDHPLSDIADLIRDARTLALSDADEFREGQSGWLAGIISSVDRMATKKGQMMATCVLEDLEGSVECVLFPQVYERYRDVVAVDAVVRVRGKLERSDRADQGWKVIVAEVEALSREGRFERPPRVLWVRASLALLGNGGGTAFKEILRRYPGRDAVCVELESDGGLKALKMGDEYTVDATASGLHAELKALLGDGAVWEG
jgi:DNA polymerase-3 subunit alpha